ncbi:Sec-independent protein translocase TatB [Microbacterium sp. CGR1]|uniref:Sec-independent protein translocase TatB n=1 Tax=Microbacterium sp. CGR1 TaxID=1696072 RepID=UPI003DA6383A
MFGLTIEKLFLVALLAAVIIGPRRLPEYAQKLGALIRRLTVLAGDATRRAEQETGVATIRQDWTALDPRQYDPRRIIREAWAAVEAPEIAEVVAPPGRASADDSRAPAGTWVIAGSSGHPRRVWVPVETAPRPVDADLLS